MSIYGTKWVETEVLLAVMNYDEREARRLLRELGVSDG